MKPFNLKDALAGAKVVTRDGKEVTQLTHFTDAYNLFSVRGVVDGRIQDFTTMGTRHSGQESSDDLFMAPTAVTRWVNVYRNSMDYWLSTKSYDSEELARVCAGKGVIATVPVTWEE